MEPRGAGTRSPTFTARAAKRRRKAERERRAELMREDGQRQANRPTATATRKLNLVNRRQRRRAGLTRPMPTDVTVDPVLAQAMFAFHRPFASRRGGNRATV